MNSMCVKSIHYFRGSFLPFYKNWMLGSLNVEKSEESVAATQQKLNGKKRRCIFVFRFALILSNYFDDQINHFYIFTAFNKCWGVRHFTAVVEVVITISSPLYKKKSIEVQQGFVVPTTLLDLRVFLVLAYFCHIHLVENLSLRFMTKNILT